MGLDQQQNDMVINTVAVIRIPERNLQLRFRRNLGTKQHEEPWPSGIESALRCVPAGRRDPNAGRYGIGERRRVCAAMLGRLRFGNGASYNIRRFFHHHAGGCMDV